MIRYPSLWQSLLLSAGLLSSGVAAAWCDANPNGVSPATAREYQQAIAAHRRILEETLRDPVLSPLKSADLAQFEGLSFFPIDSCYALRATFEPAVSAQTFQLPTFDGGSQHYRQYGVLTFTGPDGSSAHLQLFQRTDAGAMGELTAIAPFRDQTNGRDTYSGGRYLKFMLPLAEPVQVDFNRAVNPICAYNPGYPCPIPPKENWLPFAVPAGERIFIPAGP